MIDKRSYILSKFSGDDFSSKGELHVCCPFHDDKSPSFDISEDGLFICRSARCGVTGNFFKFYKMMENLSSWKDVYARLGGKETRVSANLEQILGNKKTKKNNYFRINDFPITPFIRNINLDLPYLKERSLNSDVLDYFGIVYGVDAEFDGVNIRNSLVIPIFDYDGTYFTFQVRYLGVSKLRWNNPKDSCIQRLLYGGWLVNNRTPYLWIVEGASDVWNLYRLGEQAVGLFTKNATDRQLSTINFLCKSYNLTPVLCLDGDARGETFDCSLDIFNELYSMDLYSKIIYLKEDMDPGEIDQDLFFYLNGRIGETDVVYG